MYEQTSGVLLLDYSKDHSTSPVSLSEEEESRVLPDVKVCVVYGDSSVWSVTWNTWELEKDIAKWEKEGRKTRDMRFLLVEGANHFVSYAWIESL